MTSTLSIVLATISAFLIIEAMILIIFPIQIKKILSQMKNNQQIRKISLIELTIGILLLLLALLSL